MFDPTNHLRITLDLGNLPGMPAGAPLDADQQRLLDALPADGNAVGNTTLRKHLRWHAQRFFTVRNQLADEGLLIIGRGRGGSARLALEAGPAERAVSVVIPDGADPGSVVAAQLTNELALYEPMCAVIGSDWAIDRRIDSLAVEVTALQGRRVTGGLWSRPDIVSVGIRTFVYVPGKHLEVTTFEVKAANAINVHGVYEALSHRRAATRSYLLLHIPTEQADQLKESVARLREPARMHGIGVVTIGDPSDYETWEEVEEAQRVEPDPERLDEFIKVQLSDKTRDIISRRLK